MASLVDRSSDARFDHDDRITKLRGDFTLPEADSLEDAVVSFLDEHSDELHLPNGKSTMQVVHRADTPTGGVVRLQQQVDSIPVFNSEVIVATDPDNRVRQIDLHRQARLSPAEPATERGAEPKKLTPKQAQKHAMDAIPGELTLRGEAPKPSPVWYPSADGLRLVVPRPDPDARARPRLARDRRRLHGRGARGQGHRAPLRRPGTGLRSQPGLDVGQYRAARSRTRPPRRAASRGRLAPRSTPSG